MNDSQSNDPVVCVSIPVHLLSEIRTLLLEIEQPKIRYNPDPLIMANEAVARCRNKANEILEIFPDV